LLSLSLRITLNIDDDALTAAKSLVPDQGCTLDEMILTLVRSTINTQRSLSDPGSERRLFYGFDAFPSEGKIVFDEQINDFRDREGI
jgi:hypothetical protein